jgi:protein-disulfide isomerase
MMADSSQDSTQPVSLRDETPRPPTFPSQDSRSNQTVPLVFTAVIFLLAGFLIAFVINRGNGDSVDQDELRSMVRTEVASLPQTGGSSPGNMSEADVQALVDRAVETQVAALLPTSTPIPPTPTRVPISDAVDDDAFLGPEDAPVVIVEFSDFQCGYCGRWYQQTLPQILAAYPNEVKFVYRDFPIFGEDSARAAMASECAEEQGMFWNMHNKLFEGVASQELSLDEDSLVSLAGDMGMDSAAFRECLSSERYLDEIAADYQAASSYYGFRGTPGFVINGQVYAIGAQPFDVFDELIKTELARTEAGS